MRYLTAVGTAAALLAAGIGAAPLAGAEPTTTEPTTTEPTTPEPTTPEPATAEPATAEPATTEPATTEPTEPTGAQTPEAETVDTAPGGDQAGGASQVTYTVTTTSDLTANIYYVTADPPEQSAANDPEYMPMDRTTVGPGAPWTFQTTLDDPTEWAFVSASGGLRVNPEFRCEIAVDGQTVVSQQGGSGVQCALRPW